MKHVGESIGGNLRRAGGALLVGALLSVAGCASSPSSSSAGAEPRPIPAADRDVKIKDLATPPPSAATMTQSAAAVGAAAEVVAEAPPKPRRHVMAQVLLMPRPSARLAFATQMLDASGLNAEQVEAWKRNGIHVAKIDRGRLGVLLANLPRAMSVETAHLRGAGQYAPLTLVERIVGLQKVRVVYGMGQEELQRLSSGKCQLMMKLAPSLENPDGVPQLDIMPHHHRPVASLLPRLPSQRQFDGTSFGDLRFVSALGNDEVLVLWAQAPAQAAEPEAPGAGAAEPEDPESIGPTAATTGDVERKAVATDAPLSVGEMLLTGLRRNKPVQMVVLLTLTEDESR